VAENLKGNYKDVRSLGRGMRILEALGELGWVKLGTLSAYVEIDRSTVYRLVNTLSQMGYLVRRREDGAVALTSKIARIADGVRDDDLIAQTVAPFMRDLTDVVLWPSDFASFTGGAVTIQVSTHQMSPMSLHRGLIGKHRPLIRSALGRAILSEMEPNELDAALAIAGRLGSPDARDIRDRVVVDRIIREVRKTGYASSVGATEANISAIALPVRSKRRVVGAINIVFFRSALSPEEAARKYLDPLRDCVRRAEQALAETLAG